MATGVGVDEVAEEALADLVASLGVARIEAADVADHGLDACRADGAEDGVGIGDGSGEGFLDEEVLAGPGGGETRFDVAIVGGANADDVDVAAAHCFFH